MPKKPTPKFTGVDSVKKNEAQDALQKWMEDVVKWCREVRLDIVRLEAASGLAKGDPGPPPEDPWT